MKKRMKKSVRKVGKFIYWTPRILSILFLVFLALFSLDVFDSCKSFAQCSLGLFMHNIPVFVLIALLIIAWKKEIVGTIAFFIAGILYFLFVFINIIKTGFEWYYLAWILQIAGIAFLIGILFLINSRRKRR